MTKPNVPLTPDPAGPPPGRTDWESVARRVRKSPGLWYRVQGLRPIAVASQIRTGRIPAFNPAGAYEASYQRADGTGRVVLWVRYVADPGAEQQSTAPQNPGPDTVADHPSR